MGYTTLGLMLGYGCNAKCRSCLWGEALNHGPRMSIEEACSWVDQSHSLGDLMLVGFSGGEAFLYLKEMKAIAAYVAEKYSLPSVAATNAFWAATPEKAESVLRSLHSLGLRQLLISADDFHQEWIPLERVKNCLAAAQSIGITCTLQCVVTESSNKLSYYLEVLGVTPGEHLFASEIPCTPVGWAATMIPGSDFALHSGIPKDYCTMFQALTVQPEGTVHLCCGPTFTVEALAAGNLHEEELHSMIGKAEWNPIFNALALGNGPCHLAHALAEDGTNDLLMPAYATSCHACQHILGRRDVAALLKQKLEPQAPELFLKRTILDQVSIDRNADVLRI